jgi:hypothetical protein
MHWDTKEDFEKQEWYFYLISINEVSLIAIANQLPNLTKLTGPRFEGRSWGGLEELEKTGFVCISGV